jgi:hypothetical protein
MNALTCAEVQEQLDLLAAGACDPPTRDAIECHLGDCPTCAASYAESRCLLGLLDRHWSESAVERLRRRIEQEARPRRKLRLFTPFVHRSMAAAALLLIAAGLIWWLPQWNTDRSAFGPQFALLVHPGKQAFTVDQAPARSTDKPQAPLKDKGPEAVAVMPLAAPSGEALRRDLLKAEHDGKLPPPPAISLKLALVNNGKRPTHVRLGDTEPTLSLEVQGAGVLRIAVPDAAEPEFLKPQSLQLEPGKSHIIQIDRLIAGSRGNLEFIYLTEPGEYTLTARLRLIVDGQVVTVTAEPVRIQVGK